MRRKIPNPPVPIAIGFIMSSFVMMSFSVLGLRGIFSLPVSLNANWMWRVTQLRPTQDYVAATRRALLLFRVAPAWTIVAALSLHVRPWQQGDENSAFLPLVGAL